MRWGAALAAVVVLLIGAPNAPAAVLAIGAQQDAFGPGDLDALPGDVLAWTNVSMRAHTVTADDGSFDSGPLEPGARFEQPAGWPRTITYHCTLHPSMTGQVVVSAVTLDGLPVQAVPAGEPVALSGRAASPGTPVAISASGAHVMATAGPDGTWRASLTARTSGPVVASTAAGTSRERRLLVSDRRVTLTVRGRSVTAQVTPPLPYGRLVLQVDRRERFGWWPERRRTLDYLSQATFRVPAHRAYRVALVDRDGWTALATSRTVGVRN